MPIAATASAATAARPINRDAGNGVALKYAANGPGLGVSDPECAASASADRVLTPSVFSALVLSASVLCASVAASGLTLSGLATSILIASRLAVSAVPFAADHP
jgi:hypothetical protein